jgi:hypothetical protein
MRREGGSVPLLVAAYGCRNPASGITLPYFLPAMMQTYYAVVLGVTRAYSPKCVEGLFSEVGLPLNGVLRSSPKEFPI